MLAEKEKNAQMQTVPLYYLHISAVQETVTI